MSRLKNIYTQLITNRLPEVSPWLEHYRRFTGDVAKVREALKTGGELPEQQTYAGTSFANVKNPWEEFARNLIYTKNNGISARGQSILPKVEFPRFISDKNFRGALTTLIRQPDERAHFTAFQEAWDGMKSVNRPLLVNRVLAACTTKVSTTVDEGKFGEVFWWLTNEQKLLPAPAAEIGSWREKNVYLIEALTKHFREELEAGKTDAHLLSIFVWEIYASLANPFSLKKQTIRHGAPGTGKTYKAMQEAKLRYSFWKSEFDPTGPDYPAAHIRKVQFHPSYGYEDFMEGLRPELVEGGHSRLRLQNGIFKQLCKEAAKWELDVALNVSPEMAEKWEELTIGDLLPHRPKLDGEHWQGVFQSHEKRRVSEAVPPYYLIIDEINRAELSRVLGELMFCLEYRGTRGAIQTQYAALNDGETGMMPVDGTWQFFIPHNVFIIGTMNNIDRSVESFDFALRRRFRWEESEPDTQVLEYHLKQKGRNHWRDLAKNLESLNKEIRKEALLGPDYQVGHAYLMNLKYPSDLTVAQVRTNIWEDFIHPLLREYLRGSGNPDEWLRKFSASFGIK